MPLELPDAGFVNPDDKDYAEYLSESMIFLSSMIVRKKIEASQCSKKAIVGRLESEIDEISTRHAEFMKKALGLAEVNTVYEPQDVPTHAYLLHECEGCFTYSAKVDFRLKVAWASDREIIFHSREEMQSDEGIEKVLQGETDASIHVVSCPVKSVPLCPNVVSYAAKKVQGMMEAKHPDFYEVNSPPLHSCSMFGPASAFLEMVSAIGAAIFGGLDPQVPPAERRARRYRHLTAPIEENDPRLS